MDAEHVISQIQRELDAEVIYQNRKLRMWTLDAIRAGLGQIPEANTLALRNQGALQFLTYNQRTIRVDNIESLDELRLKLNLAKTDHIAKPSKSMSITGLQSGAFKSMLEEMKKEIAAAQNDGVAQVVAAKDEAKTEIQTTIAGVRDKIKSEVSDALQEFAQFTNGGPA